MPPWRWLRMPEVAARSAQAVDEDCGRSIHTMRLENSECSVNTVRRVLAAPVLARPRGDFRGDRPEGRRPARADRLERRPAIPSSPRAGPAPPSCTRRDGGGTAGRRQAWAEDGSHDPQRNGQNAPRLARTLSEMPSVVAFSDRTDGGLSL